MAGEQEATQPAINALAAPAVTDSSPRLPSESCEYLMKREVEADFNEDDPCPSCGAEVVWAYNGGDAHLTAIDPERHEGGRIVLVHKATGEPPWIWRLDDEQLEKSRGEHENKVRSRLEEPGPHRLFVLHVCPNPEQPASQQKTKVEE